MRSNKKSLVLLVSAVFVMFAGISVPFSSRAENLVLTDNAVYGAGAGYFPVFESTIIASSLEQAPRPFTISRIEFDIHDSSSNNHDGLGNVRAWLYDAANNAIVGSTNSVYGESTASGASFNFEPHAIPQTFTLRLIADSLQGDSSFTISNLRFYETGQETNPTPNSQSATSLRLMMHFNNSVDDSSANHYASVNDGGGPASFAESMLKQAGVFNGSYDGMRPYLHLTDYPAYGTESFTANFWLNTTQDSEGVIFWRDGAAPPQNGISNIEVYNGKLEINWQDTSGARYCSFDSVKTVNDGGWHMITAVNDYAGQKISLYIDNILDSQCSGGSAALNMAGRTAQFGMRSSGSNPFAGKLDEFNILPGVITADQMKAAWNNGLGCEARDRGFLCGLLEPVVLVPGIMGSKLNMVSGGTEIWPNAPEMANSANDAYLDALKLSSLGEEVHGNEMYAGDIMREATGTYTKIPGFSIPFDKKFYKPLTDSFVAAGYTEGKDLFVAPYDWRLGIASSAVSVGAVVQNAVAHSPSGAVNIIAHSMGGLVVKDYLTQASDTAFVDKLILAGAPQLGSPLIFKTLQYGDDIGFRFGPLEFLNPQEIKSITQNMPGVYDLLPSRRYVGIEGGYVTDLRTGVEAPLDFDQTNKFLTADPGDSRNPDLLASADKFHAVLDGAPFNAPSVYNLVGCENPTTKAFVIGNKGAVDIVRGNGDGDVPVDSAMNLANGYSNYFFLNSENGVDHSGLVMNPNSIALIQSIIGDATSTLSLNPLGISTATQDCFSGRSQFHNATTIEVSTHSPVALSVFDSQGRHTGPNAAHDADIQIPGSSYETIGENTFILLPANDTYRIETDGLSSGTFTLEVRWYDDAVNLIQAILYPQVPLTSASTTATLTISSSTPNPTLSLDLDGDSVNDKSIQPSVFLNATSSGGLSQLSITASYMSLSDAPGAATSTATSTTPSSAAPATNSGGGGGGAGYGVPQNTIVSGGSGVPTSGTAGTSSPATVTLSLGMSASSIASDTSTITMDAFVAADQNSNETESDMSISSNLDANDGDASAPELPPETGTETLSPPNPGVGTNPRPETLPFLASIGSMMALGKENPAFLFFLAILAALVIFAMHLCAQKKKDRPHDKESSPYENYEIE